MDRSAKEITFDENGVCNFCHIAQHELGLARELSKQLPSLVRKIKRAGRHKKYDVLIGLSGGADSSTSFMIAQELGLRVRAFSVDNGWNTKESDENIMRLVENSKTPVPFYRYRLDTSRFLELQTAFMKAGLINAEIPTDHILMAASYEMAVKYGLKNIISGGNVATESIMPESWSYTARDLEHIKDVYEQVYGKELTGLPTCSLAQFNYYKWIKGIKFIPLLDYMTYNREESIKRLTEVYDYKEYGAKHEESVFTQWYQNYYLFEKFGIDKRKAHLSAMINSRQIKREEALAELGRNPIYPQLGFEEKIHEWPKRNHREFATDEKQFARLSKAVKVLRHAGIRRV